MQPAKKLASHKTKVVWATSNPQHSRLWNRQHAYETAKRSTARYDRRRHRPAGTRASALRAAVAGCLRLRDAPVCRLVGARGELYPRAWKADGELDDARRAQRDLLV